jgi:hypothetical protein
MKKLTQNINAKLSIKFSLLMTILLLASCGKLEKLSNTDEFDFFNSDKDERELRRYNNESPNNPPIIQFIVDNNDIENVKTFNHIKKVCDYTKIPIKSVSLNEWNSNADIFESTRVLGFYNTKKLNTTTIEKIIDFVAKGGTLYLPYNSEDSRFSFLIGLKPNAEMEIDAASAGYNFKIPMLPGYSGKKFSKDIIFFGLKRNNFIENIKVFSTAANNEYYPLITENKIGNGKVIFYNTTNYNEKADRGLLFSGILKGLEAVPYPIANVNTVHLDDFPSPLYDVMQEPIASELKQSLSDYVYKTWWPDMVKLADEFDIKYVALTTFDYDNNIQPPFLFNQWDSKKVTINNQNQVLSNWLSKEVLRNGHELGFHGYNHVSLVQKDWGNPEFMRLSLASSEKKWRVSGLGKLPAVYVPPSNIIDKTGLNQLVKGMPSIKFMCSIYNGEYKEGGNREFDFDALEPKLFDVPRTASGFYLSEEANFALNSVYLYTGIWIHFVHPDDVFQIPGEHNISQGNYALRNSEGLGWHKSKNSNRAMYPEFRGLIKNMKQRFPQLRFIEGTDGGYLINDWRASKFSHIVANGEYQVQELNNEESISEKQYWFLYGSNENSSRIEAQLKKEGAIFRKTPYLEGNLYSVFTNKSKLKMVDLYYKTDAELAALAAIQKEARADYARFNAKMLSFKIEQADFDSYDEDLKKEIANLKQKMLSEAKIDPATWNQYATYMAWEKRENEVWTMLDEHVAKYPMPDNIHYSAELSKQVYYLNEVEREKWIRMQMYATPNDKSVLLDYIESYNSVENKEHIQFALENLIKIDSSHETFLKYLEFLLTYNPKEALKLLENAIPSSDYESVASTISWLYAEEKMYLKAYEWSAFAPDIDFSSKMYWLIEAKENDLLVREYTNHIEKNPEDYKSKAMMSSYYNDNGKFKNAWIIANLLPDSFEEKEVLRASYNKDVIYEERDLQMDLVQNHVELFYPDVLKELLKNDRRKYGDYLKLDSSLETNRDRTSGVKNSFSYNLFDKNLNIHSFGATFSKMFKLDFDILDENHNVTHDVYGIEYKFTKANRENKLNYWASGRVEYSNQSKAFFQFASGINLSKEKDFNSLTFKVAPAETGGAHSKSIYRFQLNYYKDVYLFGFLNANISLEGNYYNPSSKEDTNVITGDTYDGSITGKVIYDDGVDKKFKLLPFIESSRSQASFKSEFAHYLRFGYPFWAIDDRFNYGGGLAAKFGKETDDFKFRVEGSYFLDDFSDEFQRYSGTLNYLLFDYTEVTVGVEVFIQSLYYSNAVQFGIKHSLRKKQQK